MAEIPENLHEIQDQIELTKARVFLKALKKAEQALDKESWNGQTQLAKELIQTFLGYGDEEL